MCMYLTNGNFLGQRLIGYEFYDSKSKGFVGMTEKQVITKLKNNEKVYGFVLGEEDGKEVLLLDKENFNMGNLQLKTGVNSLSWMNEDSGSDMNMELIVVAVSGGRKKVYETVNIVGSLSYAQEITVNGKVEKDGKQWFVLQSDTEEKQMVSGSLIVYNDNHFIVWNCLLK